MYLGGTDPGCHPAISQDMGALIGEFVISAVAILNAGNVFINSFRKVFILLLKSHLKIGQPILFQDLFFSGPRGLGFLTSPAESRLAVQRLLLSQKVLTVCR
jgi:hypothetical protein